MQRADIVAQVLAQVRGALLSREISLSDFVRESWGIVEPQRTFLTNWHVDLICEYLEAVTQGEIRRLIINLPPRHMKSSLVTIMWPAWEWTRSPQTRFMFASYSSGLSIKHSIDRRTIIESPWYQKEWGGLVRMAIDQNQRAEFQNTVRGHMIATSVGGTATGKGGDRLVADDLLNPLEADSKASRQQALDFFDRTFSTRLDDKKRGAIVVVEQRTNNEDLTGHLLAQGGWEHLCIPAEAETEQTYTFPRSKKIRILKIGDVLWPERESITELSAQKKQMGSRAYQSQYQQNPVPEGGNMVPRAWWKFYRALPNVTSRIWAWDTAVKKGEHNDFSVGVLIAQAEAGYYIERIFRARVEYPELRRQAEILFNAHPSTAVVIEDKSSGQQLAQELRRNTRLPIITAEATSDKVTRLSLVSPLIEAGKVFLPEDQPWVADFVEEFAAFPNGSHDDQVDATAHALAYFARMSASSWRPI